MAPSRPAPRLVMIARGVGVLTVVALLSAAAPATTDAARTTASTSAAPATTAPMSTAPPGAERATTKTVTLVTGDRVDVTRDGDRTAYVVRPGPDGATPPYLERTVRGHRYIIPLDAVPALAADRLDERLFDVTGLVQQGYGNPAARIRLIAEYDDRTYSAHGEPDAPDDAAVANQLPAADSTALAVASRDAAAFWDDVRDDLIGDDSDRAGGIEKLWLDRKIAVALDRSTKQVHAPAAWARGLDGTGTSIAVLDSGIDADHPDVADRIAAAENFTNETSTDDIHGHGTHTASTATGTGAAWDGLRKGVAPGADLYVGKVLNGFGRGLSSWIIAGMQWAVERDVDVVSMSLGTAGVDACDDPIAEAVKDLTRDSDALFVVAAGNAGPHKSTSSPACVPDVLAVGAVDRHDATAPFSSRGFVAATHVVKPEIAAPGVGILAARAGGRGDRAYISMSGTSMATPHVAGAAAIVRQAHPDWTARQVKQALVSTAESDVPGAVDEVGAGRLDVAAAVDATVMGPASVSAGTYDWPHRRDDAGTVPLEYRNDGDRPVRLRLRIHDLTGNDDRRAPRRLAALESRSLVVPAHGTARTTLKVFPGARLAARQYGDIGGRVIATGRSGVRVTTPFGFYVEPKTVTLTVRTVDRNGDPARGSLLDVTNLDTATGTQAFLNGQDVETYRVRAGSYLLSGLVTTRDPRDPSLGAAVDSVSYLGYPELNVREDTTIVLDARDARRIRITAPRPIEDRGSYLGYGRWWDGRWLQTGGFGGGHTAEDYYVRTVGRAEQGGFEYGEYARLGAPQLTMRVDGPDGFPIEGLYNLRAGPGENISRFDGIGKAELFDGGSGTPEELAGAEGKLVLATSEWYLANQVADAAKDAGAVGVIMSRIEPGRWYPAGRQALPFAAIDSDTADRLRERLADGSVRVSWHGIPNSPYVYNLAVTGSRPTHRGLRYRIRERDFARTDMSVASVTDSRTQYDEWMLLARPWDSSTISVGSRRSVPAPGKRVDFYQPGSGSWLHPIKTGTRGFVMDDYRSYRKHERRQEAWFRGVLSPVPSRSPVTNTTFPVVTRTGGTIAGVFDFGMWGDSDPAHWSPGGSDVWGSFTLRRNGVEVGTIDDLRGAFEVPPEAADYELELTYETSDLAWQYWKRSPTTTTVFGFRWARFDAETPRSLPLLFPRYAAPVDAFNTLPARDGQELGLGVVGQPGYEPAPLVEARLAYSYDDGATWTDARTVRRDGRWVADVDHADAAGSDVTLRVRLVDRDGAAVTQTVRSAYRIR